jgi:hypothetical protein
MTITKIELEAPWELLESGTLIHYDNAQPLTLKLIESDGTPIKVRFLFKRNEEPKFMEPTIKFDSYDKETIQIEITHSGSMSNFGLLKPIKLGSYNLKELYFNFRLDQNNIEDTTLIHFSWYLGKEEKV